MSDSEGPVGSSELDEVKEMLRGIALNLENVTKLCVATASRVDNLESRMSINEEVLVRVHSSCVTGDIFGSCRCDCGPQLKASMQRIQEEGCGAILYLRQEGRGIGLHEKIKA